MLNTLLVILVYAVFLLITQRISLALGCGNIFLLILFLINYYLVQFRGNSLTINDLMATGTALTVLDNYELTMSGELWYSILYFCFFIALGFWCKIPFRGKKYHLAITAVSLAFCLFFGIFWRWSGFLEKNDIKNQYWNMSGNQPLNGLLLSFVFSLQDFYVEEPEGYSEKELMRVAQAAESAYQAPEGIEAQKPNIIMIMNEAWSDLRVLGTLETTEDFMPFVDSLEKNAVKGNAYVGILGGLTANTEFEALTGDSLAFLSGAAIPYQMQISHDMYSLARVLKEQGYQTMAMHPSIGGAWNRDKVYEYFGFEEFVDVNGFQTEYKYVGPFLSDECNFNEIIWQYEHREKEQPFFLFDVTIQNHADYGGNTPILLGIEKIGEKTTEEAGNLYDINTYLNLMKVTDDAFRDLLAYFEGVEEPTLICMFGDHQPKLRDALYNLIFENSGLTEEEQQELKYITPYVIWANYDVEFPEYGDMSANYLGAVLSECAGVELPPYYQFLLQLREQYPVITQRNIEELSKELPVRQYQMLQYNHLIEKDTIRELFSARKKGRQKAAAEEWYERWPVICHALGRTEEGDDLTNSYEALLYNYAKGQRVFEADIAITSDNVAVLRHDWESDLGQGERFGWTEEDRQVPSAEKFLAAPIYEKYTPMTLLDLYREMQEKQDLYVVLDPKYSQDVRMQFGILADTALENGCEEVLDRVVVQLYYEQMYEEVREVYPFQNYLYTLYYVGYPGEAAGAFCEREGIPVLVMPSTWLNDTILQEVDNYPVRLYVHTVNEQEDAGRLFNQGVDGIYSDVILPKDLKLLPAELGYGKNASLTAASPGAAA